MDNRMKTRTLAGLLMAFSVLLLLLSPWLIGFELAGGAQLSVVFLLLLLAALEWVRARGGESSAVAAMTSLLLLSAGVCLYPQLRVLVLMLGAVLWLGLVPLLLALGNRGHRVAKGVLDWLLCMALLAFWAGLVSLALMRTSTAALWMLYGVVLVVLTDVGGYFVGQRIGRSPIMATVSPGKTWQGLGGALLLVLGVLVILLWWLGGRWSIPLLSLHLILLTLALVLFSVLGDLFESLMKRRLGLKDISAMLPGHGGLLDRIDGHLPVQALIAYSLILAQG